MKKLPDAIYNILRLKWKVAGHDASKVTDADIDKMLESVGTEAAPPTQFVAGRLGDGSLIRWILAHKELIEALFQLGRIVLPLLLL